MAGAALAGPSLLVDARVLGASGLGRYLREILARILPDPPFGRISLLGDPRELREFAARHPSPARLEILPHPGRTYSLRSQASWLRLGLTGRTSADVVFFPHWDAPLFLPARRSLVTVHDLSHFRLRDTASAPRRAAARVVFQRVVSRATSILADSEWTKRDLLELAPQARAKVRVVYCGVAGVFGPPAPEEPLPAPVRQPFLLCVGHKKRHKNLVTAVEVLARLLPQHPQLQLVVAGPADAAWDEVLDAARARGVARAIVDLPAVTDDELRVLYGRCAAFLFPSRYEGFGLPLLEAMACGAPVVASNAASIPEVTGRAALLCNPGDVPGMADGVSRLLSDPDFRRERTRLGFERAAAFDWERTARQTAEALQAVAAR